MTQEFLTEIECTIKTPNEKKEQVKIPWKNAVQEVKKTFAYYKDFRKEEILLFYNGEEVSDEETFGEISSRGLTHESNLEIQFVNGFKIKVILFDGKKTEVLSTHHCRIHYIRCCAADACDIHWGLTQLMVKGKVLDGIRDVCFFEIDENSELEQILLPLSEIILNKKMLTCSKMDDVIKYVETMEEHFVDRITKVPFLETLKELLEENEKENEIYLNLVSLLFAVAFRGFPRRPPSSHEFYKKVEECGLIGYLENKVENLFGKGDSETTVNNSKLKDLILTSYEMLKISKSQKKELVIPIVDYCLGELSKALKTKSLNLMLQYSMTLYCISSTFGFIFFSNSRFKFISTTFFYI
jgi:hypothetical protein